MSADDQREQRPALDLDALEELERAAREPARMGVQGRRHVRLASAARNALPDLIAAARERDQLRRRVAEYENAITWDTTCLNCSRLLDCCVQAEAERDRARDIAAALEGQLAKVRALHTPEQRWPCKTALALDGA